MWMRKSKRCQVWRIRYLRGDERGRRRLESRIAAKRMAREKRRDIIVVADKMDGDGAVVIEPEAVIGRRLQKE